MKQFEKLFKKLLWVLIIVFSSEVHAIDSLRTLTLDEFYTLIVHNHPVAKQASLLSDRARQELRIARGVLDPVIGSRFGQKTFDGKEYFTLWDNYLKVPVWFGLDFKAGFERNTGSNLNPENFTSAQGLSYAGVSLPIGQGLLIDERRATIRQAAMLKGIAEADRVKLINKLLLQAAKDYWDWVFYFNKMELNQKAFILANDRYFAISERVRQGDLSAIDTLESWIQVQNLELAVNQSALEYRNQTLIISSYLWIDGNIPVEVAPNLIPVRDIIVIEPVSKDSLENLLVTALVNHPEIVKQVIKGEQLQIERRIIADKFKPKLNLEYNFLQKSFPLNGESVGPNYFSNNYKFGVNFSYPLFLRTERGKFQLVKLKLLDNKYELIQINRQVTINIKTTYNELQNLRDLIAIQESIVTGAENMRRGEEIRFVNGESSVFLINSRDMYLISNQIKLADLKAKYAKNKALLLWSAGQLGQ